MSTLTDKPEPKVYLLPANLKMCVELMVKIAEFHAKQMGKPENAATARRTLEMVTALQPAPTPVEAEPFAWGYEDENFKGCAMRRENRADAFPLYRHPAPVEAPEEARDELLLALRIAAEHISRSAVGIWTLGDGSRKGINVLKFVRDTIAKEERARTAPQAPAPQNGGADGKG